jgi:hypothetical protein
MNDIAQISDLDLAASRFRLLGACDYIRIEQERLGDDLAENKRRLGIVEAELSRREAVRAAEDARLVEAKRRHDEEVAEIIAAERERFSTHTPEEEGAAAAKVNGQPEGASA